jgi:uncharacterized protein (TIGR03435 family)
MISALANHLWQSTLFAGVAGLLTLALGANSAHVRYRLWLAASLKFLVPFALLMYLGNHGPWHPTLHPIVRDLPAQVWIVGQPFGAAGPVTHPIAERTQFWAGHLAAPFLAVVWGCGFCVVVLRWWGRWRQIRAVWRSAQPLPFQAPIPVFAAPTLLEPGVFGVFRPVLLLPQGLAERLSPEQFSAVLAHEMNHVRSRDNLTAAIHMAVEAVFWFHPLVWWLGARLVAERERACDEAVCAQGCRPAVYAEAILDICKFHLESPLACAAGVTGANLKQRIEEIMSRRVVRPLRFGKKLLLACATLAAFAVPLAIGVLNAPAGRAQDSPERPQIAVASVKPSRGPRMMRRIASYPGGRVVADAPLRMLITNAYDIAPYRIIGGPSWIDSESNPYTVEATPEADPGPGRRLALLQVVLEDRFNLQFHRESRDLPIYTLVSAKGGLKLPSPAKAGCMPPNPDGSPPPLPEPDKPFQPPCGHVLVSFSPSGIGMFGSDAPMAEFARVLSMVMGRAIIDKTGFTGTFDLRLDFMPDQALAGLPALPLRPPGGPEPPPALVDSNGQSVFEALQDRLGLKLESGKGPVEVMVIDHVQKPSEN